MCVKVVSEVQRLKGKRRIRHERKEDQENYYPIPEFGMWLFCRPPHVLREHLSALERDDRQTVVGIHFHGVQNYRSRRRSGNSLF